MLNITDQQPGLREPQASDIVSCFMNHLSKRQWGMKNERLTIGNINTFWLRQGQSAGKKTRLMKFALRKSRNER
jgi:hypothetical protein